MEEFKEPMKIEGGSYGKLTEEIKEEEIIEEKPTEELTEKEETNAINEKPTNETVKTEEAVPSNEETTEPEGQEVKLYLMNQMWMKIRKQKDRRRRRVIAKMWKARQMYLSRTGRLSTTLTA